MSSQRSPFRALIGHFTKRLIASEEEQGSGGMGLGIGAVLALLASPGGFASIILMGKYSTFLMFVNGQFFDTIKRSPSDEYFFIGLSMSITGLLMVARWNRLFPDRRDFSNLAILPIPIRNIFLANLVALLRLAVLFGVVVNAASSVLFPFFVTLNFESFRIFAFVGVAHAATVFCASLFSFFAVFALVGVLMLITPSRWFRTASLVARMVLVVILLSSFFSNILVQLLTGRLPGGASAYLQWLPAYWFLGIYESILHIANPRMLVMGKVGMLALALAIVISLLAYALSYRRLFMRLPESFDVVAGTRPFLQVRLPEPILAALFRSGFERGCHAFAVKVLTRSEQHVMFFGSYLGVGLIVVAQNAVDNLAMQDSARLPGLAYFSVPLLIAFFVLSGLRFVFDRPASLDANWVFKFAVTDPLPVPRSVSRRLMLWSTISWEIALILPFAILRMGWVTGFIHTALLIGLTLVFADAVLLFFRKIPFTCSAQLDIKRLLVQMMGTAFAVLSLVPALAAIERWTLLSPMRAVIFALLISAAITWMAHYTKDADTLETPLTFEAETGNRLELLMLR
jgi:hypothetical protein